MARWSERLVVAMTILTGLLWPPAPVLACECQAFSHEEEMSRADAIFTGTVISGTRARVEMRPAFEPMVWAFDVEGVQKGEVTATQLVVSDVSDPEASCGYKFAVGERYWVVGEYFDGRLHVSGCSSTEPTEQVRGQPPLPDPPDPSRTGLARWLAAGTLLGLVAVGCGALVLRRRKGHDAGDDLS